MAKFVVARSGPLMDETVEAAHYRITECGALVFIRVVPADYPVPGQRTRDELVMAFAPGRWVEVMRSDG